MISSSSSSAVSIRPATTLTSPRCRLGTCNALLSGIYRAEKSHYCPALSAGQGYGWARARLPNHPQATREHFENHPTHDCESILQSANPMSWDRTPLGCSRAALSEGGYRWVRNHLEETTKSKRTRTIRSCTLEPTQRTTRHLG
jgi:hypothetical protein